MAGTGRSVKSVAKHSNGAGAERADSLRIVRPCSWRADGFALSPSWASLNRFLAACTPPCSDAALVAEALVQCGVRTTDELMQLASLPSAVQREALSSAGFCVAWRLRILGALISMSSHTHRHDRRGSA